LKFGGNHIFRRFVCIGVFAWIAIPVHGFEAVKRRVLVLPFDNLAKNRNFNWMVDSIADSLKDELIRSDQYEILDVSLLRRIDDKMNFDNLDARGAAGFARRLNCEVVIVGRFKVSSGVGRDLIHIEAEAVDALEDKSVVVLREDASVNTEVFSRVSALAPEIIRRLNLGLRPLDASSFRRDNRLEILIRRLQNPPVGFLDSIRIKQLTLEPDFDIDRFEYDVYLDYEQAHDIPLIDLDIQYWARRTKPHLKMKGMVCDKLVCKATAPDAELEIAYNEAPDAKKYTIRFHYPDPRGPTIARYWLSFGYPSMKSLTVQGMSNPGVLNANERFPLDPMRGYATMEMGVIPGRWQFLPLDIRYALVGQLSYGSGAFKQYLPENTTLIQISMLSAGGGIRFDRLFQISKFYGFAVFLGVYAQRQLFFRDQIGTNLQISSMQPEAGINQFFRLGRSRFSLMVTAAVGAYLYEMQNLSYFRMSMGVEYAIK